MIGGRVDFFCDDGYIFDPDRVLCRAAYPDTCEYALEIDPWYKAPMKIDMLQAF